MAWSVGLAALLLVPGLGPAGALDLGSPEGSPDLAAHPLPDVMPDLMPDLWADPPMAADQVPPGSPVHDAGAGVRGNHTGCDGAARMTIVTKRGGGPALPGLLHPQTTGIPAGTVRCGAHTVALTQGVFTASLVPRVYRYTACVGGGQGLGQFASNGTRCHDGFGNLPFRNVTITGTVGTYQTTYCAPTYCALTMVVLAGPKAHDAAAVVLHRG